jgi:hypothetical protein
VLASKGLVVIGLLVAPATAWARISGRVVGPGGALVAGAAVSAYDPEEEQARAERQAAGRPPVPLATVKTADDGSFTLTASHSFVWLEVQAAGQAPSRQLLLDETGPLIVLRPAPLRRGAITARYRLVATRAGFTPETRELELRPGENMEVVFKLRAAGDEERRPPR